MTGWLWLPCIAVCDRWDEWRDTRHNRIHVHPDGIIEHRRIRLDDDRLIREWFGEERLSGVEDTGTIVPTPEDWASIRAPSNPVTRIPRQGPRHARPKGET